MEITGGCLCGAMRYTADAEPTNFQLFRPTAIARRVRSERLLSIDKYPSSVSISVFC